MLTKVDLEAISKLMEKSNQPIKQELVFLKEGVNDLQDELKDAKTDLSLSIFNLKAEFLEETKKLGRRIREVKEILDEFTKHFDRYLQETRRKVSRIEDHLKLPLS